MSKIYVDEIAGIASPSTVAIPGHVIQVVQSIRDGSGGSISTSSTSFVDSNIDVTITPTSTSSKILVRIFTQMYVDTGDHGRIAVYRNDSTEIAQTSLSWNSGIVHAGQGMIEILDEPNSTSATVYSIYFKAPSGGTVYINGSGLSDAGITAMEIAG